MNRVENMPESHPSIQKHILASYMYDMFPSHIIFYDWLWKQEDPLGQEAKPRHEAGEMVLSIPAFPKLKEKMIRGICYPGSLSAKDREELIDPFMVAVEEYINDAPVPSQGTMLSFSEVEQWLSKHEERMQEILTPYTGSGRVLFPAHLHYDKGGNNCGFRSTRAALGTTESRDTCHAIVDFFGEVVELAKGGDGNWKPIPDDLTQYMARREFTPEELDLLLPLAKYTLDLEGEEDLTPLKPMAENMAHLSWEKLFSFAALMHDYNMEWALAAMEWGEEVGISGNNRKPNEQMEERSE